MIDVFDAKNYKHFFIKRMPTVGDKRDMRSKLADFLAANSRLFR